MQGKYPKLIINKSKLLSNAKVMKNLCEKNNVKLTGVIKGFNGLSEASSQFFYGGIQSIGSSRLKQLKNIKEKHSDVHTLALRIPMKTELDELIQSADCSLASEIAIIKLLNKKCKVKNIKHEVLLMMDLGDLREGFFDEEEFIETAIYIENELKYLKLKGIGTNLGCYGSIQPDQKNLGRLVKIAQKIEQKIGRKLEWVSGGATTTYPLMLNNQLPEGINHLRIGDGIILRDMEALFNYKNDKMYGDAFILEAEIIELKEKPSYPVGTISFDAFGNKQEYKDIGNRKRALLAVGRQDIGDMTKLVSKEPGIEVIGGSSDHTIIDVTDTDEKLKIGDTLKFTLEYENVLYLSQSEYVLKEYV